MNKYQIRVKDYLKSEGAEVQLNSMSLSQQIHGQLSFTISDEDDSDYIGPAEIENINQPGTETIQRTLFYCNPIVPLCWYSLCDSWKGTLDFEFNVDQIQRGDDVCDRFNKTEYVKNHLIYDKHQFVKLPNNHQIIKGEVISVTQHNSNLRQIYYVSDIVWCLPDILVNSPSSVASATIDYKEFAPHATFVMKIINELPSHLSNQYGSITETSSFCPIT